MGRIIDRIRSKLLGPSAASVEKALCILPWTHLHVRTSGAVLPCCVADEDGGWGSMHDTPVSQLFNSEPMRRLRQDMLAGRRSPICRRCYTLEDAGSQSLRRVHNREFAAHSAVVDDTAPDGASDPSRIVFLDVRFSNLCNLRCRSCGCHSSTSWYQDDPVTAPQGFRILRAGSSQEALWAQIEPFLAGVEQMHFAGGEPLMMDEAYQTLEKLLELGRTDVRLTYNTNVSTWTHRNWNVLELWKRFDNVKVMASLDGSGKRGEYIRKGLNWQKSVDNCLRLRRECPHVAFQVNMTLGLMNALHLPEFIDDCKAAGFVDREHVYLNYIQDPMTMSMTSLPAAFKQQVRELYQSYAQGVGSESAIAGRLDEAVEYMDSRDSSNTLPQLRRETIALDEKRGESFSDTFPELAGVLTAR